MAKRLLALGHGGARSRALAAPGASISIRCRSDPRCRSPAQDGGVVEGKLTARDDETVKVDVGRVTRSVRARRHRARRRGRRQRQGARAAGDCALPRIPRSQRHQAVGAAWTRPSAPPPATLGDAVTATLAEAVRIDGVEVLPAGSPVRAQGQRRRSVGQGQRTRPSVAARSAASPRTARLSLRGRATRWSRRATKARDAKTIGIPAAGGAVLGAVLGGKKGAAIGAAVGGGAGTAVVLSTTGRKSAWRAEAAVSVHSGPPFEVKVPVAPKSDS